MAALYKQLDAQYVLMQAYAMMSSPVPPALATPPPAAHPRGGLATYVLHATPGGDGSTGGGVASVLTPLPPPVAAALLRA